MTKVIPLMSPGAKFFFVGPTSSNWYTNFLHEYTASDKDGSTRIFSDVEVALNDSAVVASRGDVLLLLPGYTQTLTGAAGIAIDKIGVSVIGIGVGNLRPVITISSTDNAGTITMTAANTKLKNIVIVGNDDALTNALVVTGDNCEIDIETQDTSSAVEMATVVRIEGNNCDLKLKHLGFTGGNAMVSAVRLDGAVNCRIDIDFYGIVTTAVVEMVDVLSSNVRVVGNFYVSGVTDLSRNVVDTITGSLWSVEGFDAAAGAPFSGGSGNAVAVGDLSQIASDTAAILVDTGTTLPATLGTPIAADISAEFLSLPRCVEKTDGAVLTGNDDLFVITGGPIKVLSLIGIVTTIIGGASNGDLQLVTTDPAATVDFNAAPVAIDSDASGTSYMNLNTTGIFTPVTAGFVLSANSFATNETEYLCPIGTIHFRGSAAQTGVISWYLRYIPLSPLSRVVAAA